MDYEERTPDDFIRQLFNDAYAIYFFFWFSLLKRMLLELLCIASTCLGNSNEYKICICKEADSNMRVVIWRLRTRLTVRLHGMCGNRVEYGICKFDLHQN